MSTNKDAVKKSIPNISKKKVGTKKREESTDRSNVKKTEMPIKKKSTPIASTSTGGVDKSEVKSKVNSKTEKVIKVQSSPHEKQSSNALMRKNVKQKVPITPPSNRVTKSQYFPSKNLYSNALKVDESLNRNTGSSRGEKETTIKKSSYKSTDTVRQPSQPKIKSKGKEGNVLKATTNGKKQIRELSPDSSSTSERPRTATLRKGSIVNANIVGPGIPKQLVPKSKIKEALKIKPPSPKLEATDEDNYEDDFESYESDFEEYFSSTSDNLDDLSGEETSSISSNSEDDSANLPRELKSAQNRTNSAETDDERKLDSGNFDMYEMKHKHVLDNIKESIEKENANLNLHEIQRNNPASLSDEGFEDQKSLQFINFLEAKKKNERRKSMEIKRKRGEEILNMIRLDTCNFTLFEIAPVTYEVFIKNYGRNNTVQTGVQTGDDNADEEIQTEDIINSNVWTQFPIRFSKISLDEPNFWQIYKSDYLGVGGDVVVQDENEKTSNEISLTKFFLSASDLILKILAESNSEYKEKILNNSKDIPFSNGYILFNTTLSIIKDCVVKCLTFYSDNNKILTVHSPKESISENYKSVVCSWRISNSEEPESFFISYGDIICCSFGLDSSDLIYAGLSDGTISVWDLKKRIFNEDSLLKRMPLHTTEIGSGHYSKVVSLQPFVSSERMDYFLANQTKEICSLDEEGDIIIWSVITKFISADVTTSNCTTWRDVMLLKNTRISLKHIYPDLDGLQCTDFAVNVTESNYVLASTNYGFIIHHLIKGGRSNVRKFVPDSPSAANCIEVCPFSPNYALVGFDDGKVNLYSRMVEKPIMVLSDKENSLSNNSIQIIQWSRSKPFVIYAKDVTNTINIWDLNESDIYPICSIPFKEKITCMKLSPLIADNQEKKSYLMIGTEEGLLYLHILKTEYGPQSHRVYNEHLNTFLKYVNRL